MKIVHISDIHIRNLKYHDDYRLAFENLYRFLDEAKPDYVINTGDTAHTKTQISPEFVEMCSEHIRRTAEYPKFGYHILLGNHDLNLINPNRQDAISPIIDSIQHENVWLHKKSGVKFSGGGIDIWPFSCADIKNYPSEKDYDKDSISIGLFHGSVQSAVTDSNWELKETEADLGLFKGLDFVLLGDIHKHQFMDNEKRVAYAGSLIQQNFGEDPDKGFLVWNIHDKNNWTTEHVKLKGSKRFFTINLGDNFEVPNLDLEKGIRLRVVANKQFTLADQQKFEKTINEKYSPYSIISIPPQNIGKQVASSITGNYIKVGNLRDLSVQEDLIKAFLATKNISNEVLDKIFELNRKFQILIEKNEDITRDVYWKFDNIAWKNMFNYGENNIIDFSKLKGISGIFAPNSFGKSSIIDVMMEAIFDKTTKDITKNIHLVNDNKKIGAMVVQLSIGSDKFVIERTIEKIKYGKKKFSEEKEWAKTALNFYQVDDDGVELESLNGQLRPETEKNIRRKFGTFDDFALTSLLAQTRDTDIIKCKETDRKKILYKFLDLDIFEQKGRLAKDESKEHFTRLKDFDENNVELLFERENSLLKECRKKLSELKTVKVSQKNTLNDYREKITNLRESKINIEFSANKEDLDNKFNKVKINWKELKDQYDSTIEKHKLLKDKKYKSELYVLYSNIDFHKNRLNELEAIYSQRNKILNKLKVASGNLCSSEKEIKLLDTVPCGDQYPSCRFLVNAFEKKNGLTEQKIKFENISKENEDLLKKINEIEAEDNEKNIRAYNEHTFIIDKTTNELEKIILVEENLNLKLQQAFISALSIQHEINSWEKNCKTIEKNVEIDNEIKDLVKVSLDIENNIKQIESQIMSTIKEIGSKETIVKHISSEIKSMKELRNLCDAYEYYNEAMGKHGIAHQILVEKLPLINDEINKILSTITDFNVFIEHDEEEQSIMLYLQYGNYRGRRLELAGGAEKMMASIAIRAALLSITNLPKTNVFIIDEGFGSLDQKNLDNISKMFDYLRSIFDHVMIISHIDVMKDLVDNNVEISTDKEGYSHVEIL